MTVACYCSDCQAAGAQLEARHDAAPILEPDGGTAFLMQRKDRIRCVSGAEHLKEHRLSPDSGSRRVFADCCNSVMFLELKNAHWLSIYAQRFSPEDRPPIQIRTMTVDRSEGVEFSDDIPSPDKHTISFMWKLFAAWAAMGFKVPKIDYVKG